MVSQTHNNAQQQLPFDRPPKPAKGRRRKRHRGTGTSALTFEQVKGRRSKIYLPILRVLSGHDFGSPAMCLTARELLRVLFSRGEAKNAFDRNLVSPRLTELLDFGCVENLFTTNEQGEETHYLKRVDGDAAASVWRITGKGRELLDALEKLEAEVRK